MYKTNGGIGIWETKSQRHVSNSNDVEEMFSEMIKYANKNYEMKLDLGLAKME